MVAPVLSVVLQMREATVVVFLSLFWPQLAFLGVLSVASLLFLVVLSLLSLSLFSLRRAVSVSPALPVRPHAVVSSHSSSEQQITHIAAHTHTYIFFALDLLEVTVG